MCAGQCGSAARLPVGTFVVPGIFQGLTIVIGCHLVEPVVDSETRHLVQAYTPLMDFIFVRPRIGWGLFSHIYASLAEARRIARRARNSRKRAPISHMTLNGPRRNILMMSQMMTSTTRFSHPGPPAAR